MNHIALFNGIGGFQLSAQWCGWNNVAHVEIDPFCNKVVAHHFPESQCFTDIKQFDGKPFRGTIDIISGGFPCQPYSTAGKRKGKEDERHLWPEMLRTIREIQPQWVVGENVFGLINWNGGMVFDEVQADLEAAGYEVQAYVLPACAVNAPHRRDRVWFVAYTTSERTGEGSGRFNFSQHLFQEAGRVENKFFNQPDGSEQPTTNTFMSGYSGRKEFEERHDGGRTAWGEFASYNGSRDVTDTQGKRMEGNRTDRQQKSQIQTGKGLSGCDNTGTYWSEWPTQSPLCSRNDGISTRLDGITFPKWRNESIKCYGNAIVPQVAYQIFKAIDQMHAI